MTECTQNSLVFHQLGRRQIMARFEAGNRYAIMAHSDSHRRNPGLGGALTGVYAESMTDKSIIEAFKNRRLLRK